MLGTFSIQFLFYFLCGSAAWRDARDAYQREKL